MPSSRPADRFNDIISNIDAIARYVAGMSEEEFRADARTIDATEPCLSRISEAARPAGASILALALIAPLRLSSRITVGRERILIAKSAVTGARCLALLKRIETAIGYALAAVLSAPRPIGARATHDVGSSKREGVLNALVTVAH